MKNIISMGAARLRHCKNSAALISDVIDGVSYRDITDEHIITLRCEAEKLLQCVHELNAYRNAAKSEIRTVKG